MSIFGTHSQNDIAGAADRFISKTDEAQLAMSVRAHYASMPADARKAMFESVLDAFRHRGESMEDVAEACGLRLENLEHGDIGDGNVFFNYVDQNPGLLKEALMTLVEERGEHAADLPRDIVAGITAKLHPA